MPNTQPSTTASRSAVRRSVWGCLTCRRRKVKCLGREMPCAACTRLQLTCVPSFNGNFKQWKWEKRQGETPGSMSWTAQAQTPLPPSQTLSVPPPAAASPSAVHGTFGVFQIQPPTEPAQAAQQQQQPQSTATPRPPSPPPQSPTLVDDWGAHQLSPFDLDMPMSFFLTQQTSSFDAPADSYGSSYFISQAEGAPEDTVPAYPPLGMQPSSPPDGFVYSALVPLEETDDADEEAVSGGELVVAPPRAHSPALSTSSVAADDDDSDRFLIVYYKRNLSSFFSVKSHASSPSYAISSSRAPSHPPSSPPFGAPSSQTVPVWNFYSYAIRAAEEQPDSPLSHSILAWTSAHLILRNCYTSDGHAQFRHYARARAAVDDLRHELMTEQAPPKGKAAPKTGNKTGNKTGTPPLRMFLATTLFLAYGDILSGDCAGLLDLLSGVTQLLASDWPRFRADLGAVEARILVWLSYLDLRARMWAPPRRPSGKHKTRAGSADTSLFDFLQAHNGTLTTSGISTLRAHHRGGATGDSPELDGAESGGGGSGTGDSGGDRGYYLAECFGSALPARELAEDLLQEPAKMLSDEIMGVYATISALEGWIAGIDWSQDREQGLLLMGLRDARIQAIRANIARIHAESKVVHADLMRAASGADHVARTTFHRLVTTAKTLAATVLLNRVQAPGERTDDEAQAAAREIVQIARQLGQLGNRSVSSSSLTHVPDADSSGRSVAVTAGMPETVGESLPCCLPSVAGSAPHSLVWPMPVFVAGIELTDPVYQDWVLAYMADVASWGGTSTRRARELLRRVIQQQDTLGRRVNVRNVVAEFGGVLI